ncbi:9529_t:CDS:2, partial [Scutellospora calospora]
SSNSKIECLQTDVWKYFKRGQSRGNGHWEGTCKFCEKFYPYAKLQTLHTHLANSCKKVPEELEVNQLEELAKVYQFYLSNLIEQLYHTQQTSEITPKLIENIMETVFKEFEEEILIEDKNEEMSNPTEDLYSDEQDLDLNILNFNTSNYESERFSNVESDDNSIQKSKYDVYEIVARQLDF